MLPVQIEVPVSRGDFGYAPERRDETIPPTCQRLILLSDRHPRRAAMLAQRVLRRLRTDDPLMRAWVAYTLGWALLRWQRPDAARPYIAEAQDAFQRQGAALGALYCRHAELLADMQQLSRADLGADFVALTNAYLQYGAAVDAARAQLDHVRLLVFLVRPLDAAALLETIAPLAETLPEHEQVRLLFLQGLVANLRSEYVRASDLLQQAEQGFLRLGHRPSQVRCWFNQAWVLLRQERLDAALELYRRAEQQFGALDLPLDLALCAKNIGLAQIISGTYDQALLATVTALDGFVRLRRQSDIGGCHLHLGNIYVYTGCWDAALARYQQAEACYTATGLLGQQLVIRRNRALVYQAQGRCAEAQDLLAEIEGQAWALGSRADVAEIWNLQAILLADQYMIDEALQRYAQAQDLFLQLGTAPGAAECQLERGWLLLRRGDIAHAQAELAAAAPLLLQHPHHSWRADYGLGRCAALQGKPHQALEHYRRASQVVAQLRQRLANEEISSSLYILAAELHADAIQLAAACGSVMLLLELHEGARALVLQHQLAAHAGTPGSRPPADPSVLPHELRALLQQDLSQPESLTTTLAESAQLIQHIHRHSRPWSARHNQSASPLEATFDYRQVREQLSQAYGNEWTSLIYILNGENLSIIVLTPYGITLEETPYDPALQRLIGRAIQPIYRDHTYRDFAYIQRKSLRPWDTLQSLADRLIPAAAAARLHSDHRLLIVPTGPLHLIPWALLRMPSGWLSDSAIIQLMPSLTIYQILAARQPSSASAALLIGCSTFDSHTPALPAVREELCMVADRWPGPKVLLQDEQATCGAVLQRSRDGDLLNYGLVHLASHAWLVPTHGQLAHIKLSDGDLALLDVAGLRLNGALVTLSACDGAAADVLQGEEVLSISWALLAAGASAVLASFFALDDDDVLRFMAVFYDALQLHRDAATALAYTQRALGSGYPEGDLEDPRLWGSFVLIGERRFDE